MSQRWFYRVKKIVKGRVVTPASPTWYHRYLESPQNGHHRCPAKARGDSHNISISGSTGINSRPLSLKATRTSLSSWDARVDVLELVLAKLHSSAVASSSNSLARSGADFACVDIDLQLALARTSNSAGDLYEDSKSKKPTCNDATSDLPVPHSTSTLDPALVPLAHSQVP